jgi:tRNA-dihydrouridine synthase B
MIRFCGLDLPNSTFLAPMAGITTRPFRRIAFSLGSGLAWTEMISAEGLVRKDPRTRAYLPVGDEGGEVAVLIFGHRPEVLRDAALIVEEGPGAIIDINMGCPVRKIVKGGSGAALLREPKKIKKILEAVCGAVRKPVTIKIRSGWDAGSLNAVEVSRIAGDCGAAAVIVHGRTARQGFSGEADWKVVADVVRESGLPIVGSGDLKSPADVEAALQASGCAAVMIGRAALCRPWIFREVAERREGLPAGEISREEMGRLMLRHLELNVEEFGAERGTRQMRRPLAWYSRGLAGAADFRRRINTVESEAEVRREIMLFTGTGE